MARCGHMAGPCKPPWMLTWCLHGMNSDIGQSGLNRAIRRLGVNRAIEQSGLNRTIGRPGLNRAIQWSRLKRAIRRLKLHGVKSASWATISRNPTTEITRSEIRVVGHDFAQSDG